MSTSTQERLPLFSETKKELYLAQMAVFTRKLRSQLQEALNTTIHLKEMGKVLAAEDSEAYMDMVDVAELVQNELIKVYMDSKGLMVEAEASLDDELGKRPK